MLATCFAKHSRTTRASPSSQLETELTLPVTSEQPAEIASAASRCLPASAITAVAFQVTAAGHP